MKKDPSREVEETEVLLLLEGIYRHYGFDFRDYNALLLWRRIREAVRAEGVKTVSGLQEKVLHERRCLERFLGALSITSTAMFRDPSFFALFREKVVPILRTYPSIRIWNAGCSTGEEAYSLAILLQEEGLYGRTRIYATDLISSALEKAERGFLSMDRIEEYSKSHERSGGKAPFRRYYAIEAGKAVLDPSLRRNIVFAEHNLATDGSFNEFHAVFCRNVLIYFNRSLQSRVHGLLHESLGRLGYLGLGNEETLKFMPQEHLYQPMDGREKIYRRIA